MLRAANGKVTPSMGRCSGSEQLALAPVLRRFLESIAPSTTEMAAVLSGILLCDVVELLLASRSSSTTPKELEDGILRHLRAHLDAYGEDLWVPKFHYSVHLGPMWSSFGVLLACWALERKHKVGEIARSVRGARGGDAIAGRVGRCDAPRAPAQSTRRFSPADATPLPDPGEARRSPPNTGDARLTRRRPACFVRFPEGAQEKGGRSPHGRIVRERAPGGLPLAGIVRCRQSI